MTQLICMVAVCQSSSCTLDLSGLCASKPKLCLVTCAIGTDTSDLDKTLMTGQQMPAAG